MIVNKYKLLEKIGEGKFGFVYKGEYVKTSEPVAIKMEQLNSPIKLLKHETTILNYLHNNKCRSIPSVYWYGVYQETTSLVMSYYNISLFDYASDIALTETKINRIMWKVIDIFENIHSNGVIHRDIKPQNFMIKDDELFLIDFGLSNIYIDEDHAHNIAQNDTVFITGTPKYISTHIHSGKHPSRRDDLISAAYMYLFLLTGYLPWETISNEPYGCEYPENHILHYKNQERARCKKIESLIPLCNTINMKLVSFIDNVYSLEYQETPKYLTLKHLFGTI